MTSRARINLLAAATLVAGAVMLASAPPADAATLGTGCQAMTKVMTLQMAECSESGGSYTFSGSCSNTSDSYGLVSSCE